MRYGHHRATRCKLPGLGEADEAGEVPEDLRAADLGAGRRQLAREHGPQRRQLDDVVLWDGMPSTVTDAGGPESHVERLDDQLGPADDLEQ